jgi:heat shock protein HslJ
MFALAGVIILLTACGGSSDPLNGTSWTLLVYGKTQPIPGTTFTAIFKGGKINGSSGCNSYGGSYQVSGDKITVSELGMTLMACPDPAGLMDQEAHLLDAMGKAQTFQLANGQLEIFALDGEMLTFVPQK